MKYPIGIQDFEKLRREGFVYVDKTEFVYKLADSGCYYFLSRPRRFGKSLLLTTIKAYFEGKRELFAGLAIERLEQDWTEYPVLHIDLNTGKYTVAQGLGNALDDILSEYERIYGTSQTPTDFEIRLKDLIRRAYERTGKKVVILIDEYDKPILETIGDPDLQDKHRNTLRGFYSVLKTMDHYIRFAMLSGVTKLGKLSVFSGLNNLEDISMIPAYAEICGMTEDEIHMYFEDAVRELAESTGKTYDQTCAELERRYDGYHFCYGGKGMFNPFSLLNTFKNKMFGDYWFATGTPLFLVKLLKGSDYSLANIQKESVTAEELGSIDVMYRNPIPAIYQSGYLTITGYDERFQTYRLGFPSGEVERGFVNYLSQFYITSSTDKTNFGIDKFVEKVENGNVEAFLGKLRDMLADNDYRVAGNSELYFQNTMNLFFKILGFYTEVERATSRGRIDMVVKTRDYIYVMEFKLDGSAEDALKQIEEKEYAQPFAADGRKIYKIGVNFSGETRNISDWRITEN